MDPIPGGNNVPLSFCSHRERPSARGQQWNNVYEGLRVETMQNCDTVCFAMVRVQPRASSIRLKSPRMIQRVLQRLSTSYCRA
jgi:hypothetical protein